MVLWFCEALNEVIRQAYTVQRFPMPTAIKLDILRRDYLVLILNKLRNDNVNMNSLTSFSAQNYGIINNGTMHI